VDKGKGLFPKLDETGPVPAGMGEGLDTAGMNGTSLSPESDDGAVSANRTKTDRGADPLLVPRTVNAEDNGGFAAAVANDCPNTAC